MNSEREEMLFDLLIKKATEGLTADEQVQLDRMEGASAEEPSIEATIAAMSLVDMDKTEMPVNLRKRVLGDADRYFESQERPRANTEPAEEAGGGSWWSWNWLGWAVAGAAVIALVINVWTTRVEPPQDIVRTATPTPAPTPVPPVQAREQLLAKAPDVVRAEWSPGNVDEMKGIAGDVVWSDAEQAGYMRFTGLRPNDPGKETYQLWIFDETQDEKTPIDGGTFDVNASGEIVIPIDAKLKARNPKLFAVTVEKPGGVVVSKREKIVALAKAET